MMTTMMTMTMPLAWHAVKPWKPTPSEAAVEAAA